MKSKIHATAGIVALVCIAAFWLSSVYVEMTGSGSEIARVKSAILWGMAILIPSMMAVGGSGFALGRNWKIRRVAHKKSRMKFIAANGIVILLPSAIFLETRAQTGQFDGWFYAVQFLELSAGAINLTLLFLNMKDGMAIARQKRRALAASRY